ETVTRLSRVGFDNTLGYLQGGYDAWVNAGKETDAMRAINAKEAAEILGQEGIPVFDVRKESEYAAEHFENVVSAPLSLLNDHLAEFPRETTFYLHCAGGYRSVIAASILKSRGIHNLVDISGGFTDMKKAGLPTTTYVCPSTKRS
ncbi:MAG: rhodanese-like domain-containing protein, partial [Eudoraea sp.]|nr:rhodanese-like domain-containing protein [Eudoraea sp.]